MDPRSVVAPAAQLEAPIEQAGAEVLSAVPGRQRKGSDGGGGVRPTGLLRTMTSRKGCIGGGRVSPTMQPRKLTGKGPAPAAAGKTSPRRLSTADVRAACCCLLRVATEL